MQTGLTFEEKEVQPTVAERPLTGQEVALIHEAVKVMAGKCDDATTIDQGGFSKYDAACGRTLAEAATITEVQARAAKKMLKKYHWQIPEELYEALYPPVLATVAGAAQ